MKRHAILISLIFLPFLAVAQLQKGALLINDNFRLNFTDEATNNLAFKRFDQFHFETPVIDYFFHKNWSSGGSFRFIRYYNFRNNTSTGNNYLYRHLEVRPHLKYWVNFKKFNPFISISGFYLKQKGRKFSRLIEVENLTFYLGVGFLAKISKGLSWEFWTQIPTFPTNSIFSEKTKPTLDFNYLVSTGFKFSLQKATSAAFDDFLIDNYLKKYNIRFTLNLKEARNLKDNSGLNREGSSFATFDTKFEIFFAHFLSAYIGYDIYQLNDKGLSNERHAHFKFSVGLNFYLPLEDEFYANAQVGLLQSNSDKNLVHLFDNRKGLEMGLIFGHFISNRSILKLATSIDLRNQSSRYTSDFSMGIFYEFFLQHNLSIEPQLSSLWFAHEVEDHDFPFIGKSDQTWVFQIKLKTLIIGNSWL